MICNGAGFLFFFFLVFLMIPYLLSITRKNNKKKVEAFSEFGSMKKGQHFWIMNEFERVGQWMNE
jgi:hypothetical protein